MRLGNPRDPAPEARLNVTLAQAVLKGDKMDDVVRDAVMIGATAIRPVLTTRTETSAAILEKSRRQDRWERVAISSAKQCGRAVVPPILEPLTFEGLIEILLDKWLSGPAIMLVEPGADEGRASLFQSSTSKPPKSATAVVGPEGGWTPEEIEAASECVPTRDDGEQDASSRCDGTRRDLGDLCTVEGVLAPFEIACRANRPAMGVCGGFGRRGRTARRAGAPLRRRQPEQPDPIPRVTAAGSAKASTMRPDTQEPMNMPTPSVTKAMRPCAAARRSGGALLVDVDLSGDEEEVVADAVQEDAGVEHPDQRTVVAVRKQQIARRPRRHADEQHVLDAEASGRTAASRA